MNALGVSVQVIPGAEVYTALEKNTSITEMNLDGNAIGAEGAEA